MQSEEVENLRISNVVTPISKSVIESNNKKKSWNYGYNEKYDVVVISKDGTIGEVVEVQNLKIALPSVPNNVHKRSESKKDQYWEPKEYNKDLKKIKTIFDWNSMPNSFKNEWVDYIEDEFTKRDEGYSARICCL